MIQLVIWDWNGTMLADTQAWMDAGNDKIKKFGGTQLPRKQYIETFDFPVIDFYCNQGCDKEALLAPESATVFHDFYEQRASKCRTRKGVRRALSWLKNKHIASVILSNHMQEAIMNQLQRLFLTKYIEDVLANTELEATHSGKNKIQKMTKYLDSTGYNPKDTLIIGDSPEDIEIGKIIGMGTTAITDGYFSTSRLRASKPDYLINNSIEIIGIIENY